MFYLVKVGLLLLSVLLIFACSTTDQSISPHGNRPSLPDITQGNRLYTNMRTYGQYMGCSAAQRNEGLPRAGWDQAPSLPGTYQEYRRGWQEGFNKCRIGLGPVVPPGGVYP
ncbi:hypothetical protein [Endozoicomonas sp. SCSIO W0465]|uniref:hypothetical protein n=1 Tax=Endozoicomonas sp. SCSIO W0465 TaxID=2918516 RepID=UPI00207568E6|nr:hypothetical protein [Endozoicomonas sp. SCSIO W0465]USE34175.1 hypothetical protein MJO57_18635 [Endozoicomonas sp. SCSIO W0465]